jgi:Response regulator receiver domain
MQEAQARMRRLAPFTTARTACKLMFQRRLVTLWAWLMRLPNWGPRPQISQTFAMIQNSPRYRIPNYINAPQSAASNGAFGRRVAFRSSAQGNIVHSSETILVVEDAEPIRKLVSAPLSHLGYSCIEAADGTEALRLIRENPGGEPVITDVIMPHMSGAQLAGERPDVLLILMSGYCDDPLKPPPALHSGTP